MAQQLLLKVICNHQGTLNYADLADIGCGADMICALDKLVENDLCSIAVCNGNERIFAKTKVRRCKAQQCDGCNDLHLCKLYLFGDCKNSIGRRTCRFGHDLHSEHNSIVLREHKLETLSRQELRQLLLQNDNSLLPPVCNSYNKGTMPYGNCPDQEGCRRLHVCDRYIRGTCSSGADCNRCHDFFEPHPLRTLQQRGVPNDLMVSMLSTYRNIQAMKSEGAGSAASINRPQSCPQRNTEKCSRVHFKMPYKWEVNGGQTWSALPENEAIERDFCDPSKIHSEGAERVRFDSMSRGLWDVRRLSTVSSVTQPTYVLTTEWVWFWEDEYGKWIQYASIKEMHRLSSITSEDLEKRFQEDQSAVVKFTAGQQFYELSFRDMTQFNERFGTTRMVRRRPVFVSTVDAQAARSRRNRARNPSQNFRAVPGSWDKSAIPDIGYKTVTLLSSDRDYQKVQRLFNNTMRGFQITSIERVQNRDLWEVFQWKRDLMKKNNGGRNSKELHLFHGTDPKHVDAICRDNFDWRLCGTNGTVYGEGSYFARDAKYSHSFTSHSGVRSMFACQVLVGDYTRGNSALRRPPPKGEGSPTLYDSCVDNVLNPSIYVVFEKHQVYPEFLIKYDDGVMHWTSSAPAPLKTVSIQSTSLTPKSNRIQATAAATTLKRVPSTLSPSKTAATTSSNPTCSLPASRFVPKSDQTPLTSPVLLKPALSSQLVDTTLGPDFTLSFANLTHTLTTTASTPFRTLTTPASIPSHTLTTPASTPSHTLTTPANTPSRTLTNPASTPSHTLTTPASTPSYTLTTPASIPSPTLTTPASTPSYTFTTPASIPSPTLTTPASTPSYTFTTPASIPSPTLTTPASTPSYTFTTPASIPSPTLTTPASTPSYTFTTPASIPSPTLTTPASTASCTFTTPASIPSPTLTTPASTPSYTFTTPASTPSPTLTTPASTASRRLALQPPTPSHTLTLSASTLSPALSPLTGPLSLAHTRSTTTTHTLPASSTSHSLSPSSSLSTPYHTLSHSSYSPTYTQTLSHTSPSTSSNSPSTLSPSASNLSRVFSPSTGAFYRPLSTTTSTTRSPPESLYSVPTAQRRDTKETNKCLLQ
ncbi:protein mono-ADP-ribosyltransferase PARP12-like isoform X2 [Oncorhynchus keta]|uniref:protein mono-ADP-ribosyltransferase PARP12-like isoform X2 n=1 Tax=Oncorhynchus keta TaxID=8018 RepID=UPI00227B5054|nr:protein mono-ADP-ribosyltransferase PARP12-like isoform X2 [Oncorhynchus keta]